jgi:hypothetical protein
MGEPTVELMQFSELFNRAEKQMREYIEELEDGLQGLSANTGPAATDDSSGDAVTES